MKNILKISIIFGILAILAPFSVSYAATSYSYTGGNCTAGLCYDWIADDPIPRQAPTPTPTYYPPNYYYGVPTVNLSASKTSINYGETIGLSWTTSNASSCYGSNSWSGNKNLSGSEYVYPINSSTYTITCINSYGSNSASQIIYINQPVAPVQTGLGVACSISPSSPRIGNTVTFSAVESGGTAPYYYSWSGDISGTSKSVSKTFSTTGEKTATVKITDALGRTANGTCKANVLAAAPPPAAEPAPKPTPTAGQVQGATTVCKTVTLCIDTEGKITQPSPTPTISPTPIEVSETENGGKSFLASIFNINVNTWTRIKSLLKWYLAILAIILFVAIAYFVIKRITGKDVK